MVKTNYSEGWIDTYKEKLGSINFTSGDYESIKSAIRKYVSIQNPENINDWQESSETGLFVNATAYLCENINYRVDLNVNDLFPSTTKRKQSLLNFTQMLSYSAKRNHGAMGLGKIISISTTQEIYDTLGNELKNITISWDDDNNINWREQFLTILNSAFSYTNQFGKPLKSLNINGVSNQLYQMTSSINNSCVYPFNNDVDNQSLHFEVVNPNISVYDNAIVEATPIPEQAFNLLYRNDGYGNASKNTGFFVLWKQGTLHRNEYNFTERIENNYINLDVSNISQTDVWFQEIDDDTKRVVKNWTKLATNEQLSYNSNNSDIRTIFSVETQNNDKIKVKFPDGFFGDIPYGKYKLWFRTTNGNDNIYIKPSDINNISISIPYFNNSNIVDETVYYLTLTFSVEDVSHIYQSVPSESLEEIRKNAPEIYYTQDRMVSSKDYNYFPKTIGQQLKILKAVNRTHIGNSRYAPINDTTGTYTDVNIIADDGYVYSEDSIVVSETKMLDNSVEDNIKKLYTQYIVEKLSSKELENLYYKYYNGYNNLDGYKFKPISIDNGKNYMKGYIVEDNMLEHINLSTEVHKNDILCLSDNENNIVFVTVVSIDEDKNELIINEILDINKEWIFYSNKEKKIYSRMPGFKQYIEEGSDTETTIIRTLTPKSNDNTSFIITYSNQFGENNNLEDDIQSPWIVMPLSENDVSDEIKETDSEDVNKEHYCMNWIFKVEYDTSTKNWKISHRETKNIFGSKDDVSFFLNEKNKLGDNSGYILSDDVIKTILFEDGKTEEFNLKPYNTILYSDGYTDRQRIVCEGWDGDKDSQTDIPTFYNTLTKNNDLIIMLNDDTLGGNETFLDFVDLYSTYENGDDLNTKAYNSSLWEHTDVTGYYYTYNKINKLIVAGSEDSGLYYTPNHKNIILSNGTITSFSGSTIAVKDLDYDFVDYIKGYDEEDNPIFYNDLDENDREKHGYLYYLYIDEGTKILKEIHESQYKVFNGKKNITFVWKHKANEDYIIDPCTTNIIDMFVLTNDYYNEVQEWIKNGKKDLFPKAPSATELKGVFKTLENNKMISDTMVWHPITYKLLFGYESDTKTRCIFKIIKQNELLTDNEVKKSVVNCIDAFFREMTVGQSFYFTQLSTYIETNIPNVVKSVIIVPTDNDKTFGELFQVSCEDDQILLSTASLSDVQIISSINSKNIRMSN